MTKRVALVWYTDKPAGSENGRLKPLYDALVKRGVHVDALPYSHETHDSVTEQLQQGYDGMMVWMNPIEAGQSRERLDAVLGDLVTQGVMVSARPDIIQKMGTKAVIHTTRSLSWGTDSTLYETWDDFAKVFPQRLMQLGTRVLKQGRGSSGAGVWKVELVSDNTVQVMNAGDDATQEQSLASFIDDCKAHFASGAYLVEQPYLPRVNEGMIRCYMNQNRVIGILHQLPKDGGMNVSRSGRFVTDGLPEGTGVYMPDSPRYVSLVSQIESEWIEAMCKTLDMDLASLPILWDIDFIMGDKTASGADSYFLCEINVSSVSPPRNAPFDQLADSLVNLL